MEKENKWKIEEKSNDCEYYSQLLDKMKAIKYLLY